MIKNTVCAANVYKYKHDYTDIHCLLSVYNTTL